MKVKEGHVLARLDDSNIRTSLEVAQAQLDSTRLSVEETRAQLKQADQAFARETGLAKQNIASQADLETAESEAMTLRARLRRQEVDVTAAERQVAMWKQQIEDMVIRAPFDGVVTRKWADVGDLAAPGKPLVAIEDPSALQLEADVPQGIAARVHQDARLPVRVDDVSGDLTGTVNEIGPTADPVSHTVRVKVDLAGQPGLSSGQFARLRVPVGESNSLRVPVAAVVQRGQLEIVFVVANQHAQLHLVKTGKRVGEEVEILSGLHAGDAVVVEGAAQLTDGQPVEAK